MQPKQIAEKFEPLIVDGLFLILIVLTVYLFVDYRWGHYLLSGDFRFSVWPEVRGDQFLHLVSEKYSNNNFVFLSFYPVYWLSQFVSYNLWLAGVIFLLPVLAYLTSKYVLVEITRSNNLSKEKLIFIRVLAFLYAINPSLFDRYGHWPIVYSAALYPLYIYILYRYLVNNKIISKYVLLLSPLLYISAIGPQSYVIYTISAIALYMYVYTQKKRFFKSYLLKGAIIFIASLISFVHVIYSILIGYGVTRSRLESDTTSSVLYELSKNSNIFTGISGTSYYAELIKFPFPISTIYIVFCLLVFILLFYKHKKNDLMLIIGMLSILGIVSGYKTLFWVILLVKDTVFGHFLWLIKDPNMYYQYFLFYLIALTARAFTAVNINKRGLWLVSIIIILAHLVFYIFTDKSTYRNFYHFVKIPPRYEYLASSLATDSGRNLWLPSAIYTAKQFSEKIPYFPDMSLWLTINKELTKSTEDYEKLIQLIENEIYDKSCQNIYLIDWIIAAQGLNIIIDEASVNNQFVNDDTKINVERAHLCLMKLPNLYLYKAWDGLYIYKSRLKLTNDVIIYDSQPDKLNEFVKNNHTNIAFGAERYWGAEFKNLSIYNESYDDNWRDKNNKKPLFKVNFASMAFQNHDAPIQYRGEMQFDILVYIQKILIISFLIIYVLIGLVKRD